MGCKDTTDGTWTNPVHKWEGKNDTLCSTERWRRETFGAVRGRIHGLDTVGLMMSQEMLVLKFGCPPECWQYTEHHSRPWRCWRLRKLESQLIRKPTQEMEAFFPIPSFHSTFRFIREVTRSLTADHMTASRMNIAFNWWLDLAILSNYLWRWDILTKGFLTACWEHIMVKTYNSRVKFQVRQEASFGFGWTPLHGPESKEPYILHVSMLLCWQHTAVKPIHKAFCRH